jgi:Uma2 family endonuclease
MSAVAAPPEMRTFADVLERLGDVPPHRVRLRPQPGTATDRDVIRECAAGTGPLCELVDGVLVEKTMGFYESRLAVALIFFVETYLTDHDLGIVLGEAGMVRIVGQVRMPDVSFLSWDHFPGRILPPGAILDRVPDFVVEVISPDNTEGEMERKRREFFGGGGRLFWQVYPDKRRVRVYTTVTDFVEHGEDDTLDGGAVLPGFQLSIRTWFDRAGRRGPA